MSEIYEAIKTIAQGEGAADVGVVTSVDEASGRCDVAIEGKAPAIGAWMQCGGDGLTVVPEEGSDVVVVWLNQTVAVVVMAARARRIVMRGGQRGGLVNVEALKEWMSHVEADLGAIREKLATSPVAGNGAPLGIALALKTTSVANEIEDEEIKH